MTFKVLVTGGAGFIGSALVGRLVEDGASVTVLDTMEFGSKLPESIAAAIDLRREDVRDPRAVRDAVRTADVVFHFAALMGVDVVAGRTREMMTTEVEALRLLTEAIRQTRTIVYASTSSVYGPTSRMRPAREPGPLEVRSGYASAKHFGEVYLRAFAQETGIDVVALRLFNVYGPGQDERMVVPRFFDRALRDAPIPLFSGGRQTRDFTWVDDAAEAALRASETRGGGFSVYNVATGEETTIRSLAERICALTGSRSPLEAVPLPKARAPFEVDRRVGCADALTARTGWRPVVSLENGLERMAKAFVTRCRR